MAAVSGATPIPVRINQVGMEVIDIARGVMVTAAYRGSHAKIGGIQHADIIYKFNHRKVTNIASFKKLMAKAPVERRVQVKVYRGTQKVKLNVMIGAGELDHVTLPPPRKWNNTPQTNTQAGAPAALQRGTGQNTWCPPR